jgi:hypothetical protein
MQSNPGIFVGGPFDGYPCFVDGDEDAPLLRTLFQLETLPEPTEEMTEHDRVQQLLETWRSKEKEYAQPPFGTAALYRREPGTSRFLFVRYLNPEEWMDWCRAELERMRRPRPGR